MSFFEVDKEGLAKIAERRGKAFLLYELLQNAWDTDATIVKVDFQPEAGRPLARLTVEDDAPDGFKNLSHAWTLFAESEKKGDAEKRGRFNLGEKLVLALCKEAEIITTTGSVRFDAEGRKVGRKKLSHGSVFTGLVRMTRDEYDEALAAVKRVIPGRGCATFLNGERLRERECVGVVSEVALPTEIANEEGYLKRVKRHTHMFIYEVAPGEVASLFEMGIPVMETSEKFHVDVQQKVPLNMERDGVPPAYLRTVRAAVLNELHAKVKTPEEAAAPWIRDAISSPDIKSAPVKSIMDTRFGLDRVVYDPSDREANNIAMSKGMTVIHGASMSAEEWENVRKFEAAKPAGQVTPSPKPFSPGGRPLKLMDNPTPAVTSVLRYFSAVAPTLIGAGLVYTIADDPEWGFNGCFKRADPPLPQHLTVNYALMKRAIESNDLPELNRFLIHELAHHYESNHLAEGFHEACCRLGAKLVQVALNQRELFEEMA